MPSQSIGDVAAVGSAMHHLHIGIPGIPEKLDYAGYPTGATALLYPGTSSTYHCFRANLKRSLTVGGDRNWESGNARKTALSGIAIAAVFAITVPVWAQTSAPTTPSTPSAGAAAPGPMAEEPAATTKRHHRRAQRRQHAGQRHASHGSRAPSDNMANQLNAEELSRSQGGAGGSMPPPGYGQQQVPPQMQGNPPLQGGPRSSGH